MPPRTLGLPPGWRRALRQAALTGLALVGATQGAMAQSASASTGPSSNAEPLTRADSIALLAQLDSAVRRAPTDAALWHRRGRIAWELVRPIRDGGAIRGMDNIRLMRVADTSLNLAAQFAPNEPRYRLDFARYRLEGRTAGLRYASRIHFATALETARRVGNQTVLADAAYEVGMGEWREFETFDGRRILTGANPGRSISEFLAGQRGSMEESSGGISANKDLALELLNTVTAPITSDPPPGAVQYDQALAHFREATQANPGHIRAWRATYAALAARERWVEVSDAATRRLTVAPWDPDAWMARGLAAQRRSDFAGAKRDFDSAFVYLNEEDRVRLDRLERLTRRTDSARVARLKGEDRTTTERLFWLLADPLWSREGNEARTEFLARVTYAEFRWSAEELGVRGADTDRGDIHVRYGPPRLQFSWVCGQSPERVCQFWWYRPGLQFVFELVQGFNLARGAFDDANTRADLRAQIPAQFANVASMRGIDSLSVQVARFRDGSGGTEAFVAAAIPVGRLLEGVDAGTPRLDANLWLLAADGLRVVRDSARIDRAESVVTQSWRSRAPSASFGWRVEATSSIGERAARATGVVGADSARFATSGFSLSDILLARRVESPANGVPTRWHELSISPLTDVVRRGQPIALVWENYGLTTSRDGGVRYRVEIRIQKTDGSAAGRIAARILDGVSGAIGRESSGERRVNLGFERQGPAAAITLDQLSLSLGTAPTGVYRLTVEVTDLVAQRRTERTTRFRIIE